MSRKLSAFVLSSALLWMSIAASAAEPAAPAQASAAEKTPASPGNSPPLPPGRALEIKTAQGEQYSDLGPGVIVAAWAVGIGALVLLMFGDGDDDESSPATGAN